MTTACQKKRKVVSIVAAREAREALEFARCHDWGFDARLRTDPGGNYYLTNLIDCYVADGVAYAERCAIPATIEEAYSFAQS